MNLINGYWINYTGSIIVEIYYKPLEWFKRGVIVSLISLLVTSIIVEKDKIRKLSSIIEIFVRRKD